MKRNEAGKSWISSAASTLLVLALVLPTVPYTTRAEEPRHFAIRGARIIPVSGAAIENGTVVVRDGLIAAVGASAPIPPEAWVIDGKGLTVYPGFIDAQTDLGLQAAAPAAPAGAPQQPGPPAQQPAQPQPVPTGPEDRLATTPWVNAADEIRTSDRRIETWRDAGFTTALSAPTRGIFPGQGAVINLAGERPGHMVVQAPATLQITFQGAGGGGYPGSLMGVIAYLRQVFIDTEHYAAAQPILAKNPRARERLRYDRTVRVLSAALRAERPVLLPASTQVQMRRAADLAEQFKLKAVFTGAHYAYEDAAWLGPKKIPVIASLRWPEKPRDADPELEESLRVLRHRDKAHTNPAALHKAGVKFAFTSDGLTAPKDMLKNARKAMDAGLPADAAIRAFTLSAAEILGVADRLGSLEPGKIANLAVTDGDIFNERTKVKFVFVDGRRFEVREEERPRERPTVNMTGHWTLNVHSPGGAVTATADLRMEPDGTLTGSITSQMGAAAISRGWVSGNSFSFTFSMNVGGGGPADIVMSGTVEGNTLKGSAAVGGQSMEITGTKPGAAATEAEAGGAR
jgi:imidazolonepropionase-like amidohydrolase